MTAAAVLGLAWPPAVPAQPPGAQVFGEIVFGSSAAALQPGLAVACPVLVPAQPWALRWQSAAPVLRGEAGGVSFAESGELLFATISVDERAVADAARAAAAGSALEHAARRAYEALFALLDARGHGKLLRVWNYVPRINEVEGGLERYRQFNIGRQDAFAGAGRVLEGAVPAACALGVGDGALAIACLASRRTPLAIENPRQVSAYHYPSAYGPRSPTFARAALLRGEDKPLLFISGTASIVGHRSLHVGDVVAQTHETFDNIEAVLAECARVAPEARYRVDELACVAYLRRAADLDAVRAVVEQRLGPRAQCTYVEADICRADLLVEIEASAGHPNLEA